MKLDELDHTIKHNMNKCKVSKYKNYRILRYNYDDKDKFNSIGEKYMRGLVIDKDDNILMCPPMKSLEISIDEYFNKYEDNDLTPIIDGVMINLFYADNMWNLSTRSSIGGYNKWTKGKNFKSMFDECRDFDYEDLDKDITYSFLMRHKKNSNISNIYFNELYLIEIRDKNNLKLQSLDNKTFKIIDKVKVSKDSNFFNTYEIKGYTFYNDNIRYKITNNLFEYVKNLKGNNNNEIINILKNRQEYRLNEYLLYFPHNKNLVDKINKDINDLINDIYVNYVNLKITKTINMNNVQYHIRPCLKDLHNYFLTNRIKINKFIVRDYINNLSIFRLKFILNYIN